LNAGELNWNVSSVAPACNAVTSRAIIIVVFIEKPHIVFTWGFGHDIMQFYFVLRVFFGAADTAAGFLTAGALTTGFLTAGLRTRGLGSCATASATGTGSTTDTTGGVSTLYGAASGFTAGACTCGSGLPTNQLKIAFNMIISYILFTGF
jgi:hypothetical protein